MSKLTWNDPLAKLIVFRSSVKQPPTAAVDLLAVVLEMHVVVEARVPEADVAKLVLGFGPCLKPVRTAERHRQTGQRKHAPAETDPGEPSGRSRLFIRYLAVRHCFYTCSMLLRKNLQHPSHLYPNSKSQRCRSHCLFTCIVVTCNANWVTLTINK